MIPSIFLPALSKLLNHYLACDPEMQLRLNPFNGRVLRATISTLDWSFYIKIKDNHLELVDSYDGPIDAAFKAGITSLSKAAFSDKATISEDIELHGDTAMIQTITQVFKQVEIDWEGCLANYTGDTIAHGISTIAKEVKNFHNSIFDTNKLNIKEYLQEEINLLVSPFALEDYCADVDQFRDAVERIEAKICLMEHHDKED